MICKKYLQKITHLINFIVLQNCCYSIFSTSLPELLLATAKLFHGQRELLCSFTQFLPPGHSIFILNNDPTQVKIRLPSKEPMSMEELQQHIEQDKEVSDVKVFCLHVSRCWGVQLLFAVDGIGWIFTFLKYWVNVLVLQLLPVADSIECEIQYSRC